MMKQISSNQSHTGAELRIEKLSHHPIRTAVGENAVRDAALSIRCGSTARKHLIPIQLDDTLLNPEMFPENPILFLGRRCAKLDGREDLVERLERNQIVNGSIGRLGLDDLVLAFFTG